MQHLSNISLWSNDCKTLVPGLGSDSLSNVFFSYLAYFSTSINISFLYSKNWGSYSDLSKLQTSESSFYWNIIVLYKKCS